MDTAEPSMDTAGPLITAEALLTYSAEPITSADTPLMDTAEHPIDVEERLIDAEQPALGLVRSILRTQGIAIGPATRRRADAAGGTVTATADVPPVFCATGRV